MAQDIRHYRVFIASPGGLDDERRAFRDVLHDFNTRDGIHRGMNFDPWGWELTLGQQGRPQEIINKEIKECDYFVLMLHDRWGTPPGDPAEKYTSGTEEEFGIARQCLGDSSFPMEQIVILFKSVHPRQLADPGTALKKVLDFRKSLEQERSFLFQNFDELPAYRSIIERHLANWARQHHENNNHPIVNLAPHQAEIPLVQEDSKIDWDVFIKNQVAAVEQIFEDGNRVEAEIGFARLLVQYEDPWVLVRFGRFLRKTGNRHRATELLTRALEYAKQKGDQSTEAYAIRQLGQVRERNGDTHGAIGLYRNAIELYTKCGDEYGLARTYRDLGLGYKKIGDFPMGLDNLKESETLYRQLDHPAGIASALGYRGIILKAMGRLSEALKCHEDALEIHSAHRDERGEAASKSNLGILERMIGHHDDAERHHTEALATYEKLHDLQGQTRELSNLGTVARSSKQIDRAIDYHQRALAIAEQLQNINGIAIQFSNLGRDYTEKGQFAQAIDLHTRSLAISRQSNDSEGQGWQFEALGNIAALQRLHNDALGSYENARQFFERIGARFGLAVVALAMGKVYVEIKNRVQALNSLNEARLLFLEMRLETQAAEAAEIIESLKSKPDC